MLRLVISLFSIVRFPNTACTTSTQLNGTCFTSAECSSNGGVGSGTCASGFGVCCVGMAHYFDLAIYIIYFIQTI